jgi:hypothetical protein
MVDLPFPSTRDAAEMDIGSQRQDYIGLTQVCRQIRSEYLPINKSHNKATPSILMMYEHIDTLDTPMNTSSTETVERVVLDSADIHAEQLLLKVFSPKAAAAHRQKISRSSGRHHESAGGASTILRDAVSVLETINAG